MDKLVTITTEYIKLSDMMKLAGAVNTGGEAKQLVQSGHVQVGGALCLQRGKKMRDGESFTFRGETVFLKAKTE